MNAAREIGTIAQLATVMGNELVASSFSRKYYYQKLIRRALDRHHFPVDFRCWAYSPFMSHGDFDGYHCSIGDNCDYLSMQESMVSAVTEHASDSWFDFDATCLD